MVCSFQSSVHVYWARQPKFSANQWRHRNSSFKQIQSFKLGASYMCLVGQPFLELSDVVYKVITIDDVTETL